MAQRENPKPGGYTAGPKEYDDNSNGSPVKMDVSVKPFVPKK